MSLVNEYRNAMREKLGLSEEDPSLAGPASGAEMGGMTDIGSMDEQTLNSVLELLQNEIAKREAVEPEGMEDPAAKTVGVPEAGAGPAAEGCAMEEAEQVADDIYFEMLNTFKANTANCEDANRKNMYKKCYNYLYKMREKFLKEMIGEEEQPAQAGQLAPVVK
jgi:hypothetical protein